MSLQIPGTNAQRPNTSGIRFVPYSHLKVIITVTLYLEAYILMILTNIVAHPNTPSNENKQCASR